MASNKTETEADLPSEYAVSLLGSLYAQMKTEEFCDVVICVDCQEFHAHKNILAAASPYFHAMFAGGLSESHGKVIQIYGTEVQIFEMLLKYTYTGSVEITEENCQDLLSAADLFGLSGVLESCCLFLEQHLDPSNCIGIFQLADAHYCMDLKSKAENFIHSHFVKVYKEEEFLSLRKKTLLHFISSENLHIDSEIQVFSAALQWIKADLSSRRTSVFEVMCSIRFPLISSQSLTQSVEDCLDLGLKIAIRKIAQDYDDAHRGLPHTEKLRKTKPFLFEVRKGARTNVMVVGGYNRLKGSKWSEGETLSSVELLDTFHMSWKSIPQMKYCRKSHATVLLNGLVYVLGGECDSLIYDSVECYDPVSNKWSLAPCMIFPRCAHGAAVVDEFIYAMGGWVGSEIGTTVERFNSQLGAWCHVGRMATPRISMGLVAFDGLIYVFGGVDDSNYEISSLESYNPVTKEWSSLARMVTPRSDMAACSGNNCLYAIGGNNKKEGTLSTIEKYDINKNSWSTLTRMTNPRSGAAAVCLNGMLYVTGGSTSSGDISASYSLDTVDCYDIDKDTWIMVGCLGTGRYDMGLVVI